jgi:hypothetical protein
MQSGSPDSPVVISVDPGHVRSSQIAGIAMKAFAGLEYW